jgi:aldehyde dehydrogenase (NAD+)
MTQDFGIAEALKELGLKNNNSGVSTGSTWLNAGGEEIKSYSPVDGKLIGSVTGASESDYQVVKEKAKSAFTDWRKVPAPLRGEIVRQIGDEL